MSGDPALVLPGDDAGNVFGRFPLSELNRVWAQVDGVATQPVEALHAQHMQSGFSIGFSMRLNLRLRVRCGLQNSKGTIALERIHIGASNLG